MIQWIQKKLIKLAMKSVKTKLSVIETKQPDLAELRKNIFALPIPKLLEYVVEKLAKEELDTVTLIDYIKKLLDKSIAPDVDVIVETVIDTLDPTKE